jgi:hypothetical protein
MNERGNPETLVSSHPTPATDARLHRCCLILSGCARDGDLRR